MSFGSQAWTARQQGAERFVVRLTMRRFLYFASGAVAYWLLALLIAALLSAGGWRSLPMWLALLLFLAMACLVSSFVFAMRPAVALLEMDALGLRHATAGSVRWSEVLGLGLDSQTVRGRRTTILAIGLEPGARPRGGWPWLRYLRPAGKFGFGVQGLDHTPEEILAEALRLRDRVSPGRS